MSDFYKTLIRRPLVRGAAALTVLGLSALTVCAGEAAVPHRRPNVLYVFSDMQRGHKTYDRNAGPPPTLEDVPYGSHERLKLDFWKAASDKPTPVLVFFHGGGGDKLMYRGNRILVFCLEHGISAAGQTFNDMELFSERVYPYNLPSMPEQGGERTKTREKAREISAIYHVTEDDPLILMTYGLPLKELPLPKDAPRGELIHNPAFGLLLKEKLDELGIENYLYHAGNKAPADAEEKFIFKHFFDSLPARDEDQHTLCPTPGDQHFSPSES